MRRYRERHPEKFKWSTPAKRASAAKRRAVKRGATSAEIFKYSEIFDRDGWRCQICRRAVKRTLAHPHPRSASLDHIVPLCDGGEHSRANVRLTHLECNTRKHVGTGPSGDQLRLIG